jgi:hypothetical protein
MTLKEKFIKESLDIRYQVLEPKKFEQIADDYAIEFAKWMDKSNYYIEIYKHLKTYEELLEIFKKEKGYV